jgi:hypothetical protein
LFVGFNDSYELNILIDLPDYFQVKAEGKDGFEKVRIGFREIGPSAWYLTASQVVHEL